MAVEVFAVPIFFIIFRESLETVIIVSVLLAFLKQTLDGPSQGAILRKRLVRQVWFGTGLGLLICLIIGGGLIGAFYALGKDNWATTEYYWEGSFALVASLIITIVGAALLRVSKMQEKWQVKLAIAMDGKSARGVSKKGAFKRYCEKYAMFMLPFITVLREGLEAIAFVAGVSFSAPATAVPLPVVVGLFAGCLVGYILYKSGASAKLQYFLVASTCLLYLVAAGLFSKAVWFFEAQQWNNMVDSDAAELGSGPGSYDITKSVWHVNFANPNIDGGGGWGVFNSLLGWQNSATYGTVISYNVYWIAVIAGFFAMRYREVKGHWPLMGMKKSTNMDEAESETNARASSEGSDGGMFAGKERGDISERPLSTKEISA